MNPTPYSARRRDRYQLAVTTLTGLATAGCLAATGWIAGQAAHTWAEDQPAPTTTTPVDPSATSPQPTASVRDRSRARRPALRPRPTRTRVTTRYVTPAAPVGGGGSVSSGSSGSSGSSQPTHSNPAPAPSSGS